MREPKTLAAQHEEKDVPEKQELKPIAEESESSVAAAPEERPLPSVTSDLVAVILDENRAITEQPITNTNLLALEQEHQQLNVQATTPKPNYEESQHQVTKKQGVEDLLPIEQVEKKEEVASEPEPAPAPEPTVEVAAEPVPESVAEPAAEPAVEAAPAAQEAVDAAAEAAVEPAVKPAVESAVEPAGEPAAEGIAIETASEAASAVEVKVKPVSQVKPTSAPEPEIVQAQHETDNNNKEDQNNHEPSGDLNEIEENVIESDEQDKVQVQPVVSSVSTEASVKAEEPVLYTSSESIEVSLTPTEATEVKSVVDHEESNDEEKVAESSSTAAPAEPEVAKHDSSADDSSDESGETGTEQPAVEADKQSSEESEELSADEAKARAEDSTATPLVSYPPHNSGRTFDSNLADESSAYHSLATNNRSTLIIALCSGTAVVFIIISLVIFLLSFQRQHGTLDIEMQEQRLGKDNLDEEDAQLKLLDVDLSTPVIIAMGNEETDECL